jgi:hypothetical protein
LIRRMFFRNVDGSFSSRRSRNAAVTSASGIRAGSFSNSFALRFAFSQSVIWRARRTRFPSTIAAQETGQLQRLSPCARPQAFVLRR